MKCKPYLLRMGNLCKSGKFLTQIQKETLIWGQIKHKNNGEIVCVCVCFRVCGSDKGT